MEASLKSMNRLLRLLEQFRLLNPEMELQTATALVLAATKPGMSMKELSDELGITPSSVTRNIAALGKTHRNGSPGYDLVQATEDPAERRRKVMRLTPKGKRLMNALAAIFDEVPNRGA